MDYPGFSDNNDTILECILKNLDLREQLKMTKVAKRFEYILKYKLWPKTHNAIAMYKIPDNTIFCNKIHNSNSFKDNELEEVKLPKIALKDEECLEFLILNKENIKTLKFCSKYECYVENKFIFLANINKFQNLRELICCNVIIKEQQMEILAEECKKLTTLHLIKCFNINGENLIPGTNFAMKNIYNLKQLQELLIENGANSYTQIETFHIQEILIKLNLKKLILKNFYLKESEMFKTKLINNSLEILDIGIISAKFFWKFLCLLKQLKQIKELYIRVYDCNTCINGSVINILQQYKKLETLTLENCDLYIKDFSVLKQLKHLQIKSCGGLTFDNFQQILAKLNLKTFTLIKTRILGKPYNLPETSSSLEIITIDSIHFSEVSNALSMSTTSYENLHTLNFLNGAIKDNWVIEKCPKLRTLTIPSLYLQRSLVFSIKTLKELTFSSCLQLNWDFIFILLKHLTLKSLYLQTLDIINDEDIRCNCGLKTTLQMITLPCNIFRMSQSFWLDLLFCNETLNILIYGKAEDVLEEAFLFNLINDIRFCRRVKKLNICGFELDCLSPLPKMKTELKKINTYTYHYKISHLDYTLEM